MIVEVPFVPAAHNEPPCEPLLEEQVCCTDPLSNGNF